MEIKTESSEIPNSVMLQEIAGIKVKSVSTAQQTDLSFQKFDEILKRKVKYFYLTFLERCG